MRRRGDGQAQRAAYHRGGRRAARQQRPGNLRKFHVHPAIPQGYIDRSLLAALETASDGWDDDVSGLEPDEVVAMMAFLRQRLGTGNAAR
jgi:hypothetical protein